MKIVNAFRDLGKVGTGVSDSHYFECDDGKEYVVKFVEQGKKTAVNELVGESLALTIQLPTPNVVQVNISQKVLDLSDSLKDRHIQSGTHIGIERIPKEKAWSFKDLPTGMLDGTTLINRDDLYGVIAFDNWVINDDRDNPGNNMIEFLDNKKIRYIMIDFGNCFTGNGWTKQQLEAQKNSTQLLSIFPFIKVNFRNFAEFDKWLTVIEDVSETEINKITDSVPTSWNLTVDEKLTLVLLIKERKNLTRQIINNNKEKLGFGN